MTAFGCQVNVRHILPGKQEAGAHGSSGCHLVAGELVQHKLVVRLVSVQRLDQPVAVAPCVGANLVVFKTVRLGKTCEIQPMLRPAFAISRRSEQRLNQPPVGIRPGIRLKRHNGLGAWQQAKKVEVQPTNQRASISLRCKRQTFELQLFENEMIDQVC